MAKTTDAQRRAAATFVSYRKRGIKVGDRKKCKQCDSKTANRFGICNRCRGKIIGFYNMQWIEFEA